MGGRKTLHFNADLALFGPDAGVGAGGKSLRVVYCVPCDMVLL